MLEDLTGRTAFITGASRGFGRELALQFAKAGANLILAARTLPALHETIHSAGEERTHSGQKIGAIPLDLARPWTFPEGLRICAEEFGGIDILVNNAAIQGPIGPFEANDPVAWRQTMEVNFLGPAELCRLAIPQLRQRRHGKIINISGGGATGPRADFSAYGSSKAALVRFSETLAVELAPDEIDVNCIAPGAMNTQMLEEILAAGPDAAPREFAKAREQKRTGGSSPTRAAELVVFLASAQCDGITGRLISAVWDPWESLPEKREALAEGDIYTLRRIVPGDRGQSW